MVSTAWTVAGWQLYAKSRRYNFLRESDGNSDHVGIVEKIEDGIVYTIEGNSDDACKQRNYPIGSSVVCGYGIPLY